jgi:hypothetical protein
MSTQTIPARSAPTAGAATRPARWTGAGLLALAAALAAIAVLGPLVTGAIEWRISDLVRNQLLGLDAVSLVLVAPLAAAAGVLAWRGSPLGMVLGLPPAFYAAYMLPQYVLGPDYGHLAGNNERAFPLMLAAFALGVVAVIATWSEMDLRRVRASESRERLVGRVLLPVMAVLVFSRYAAVLPDIMSADPQAEDYLAGPTFMWTIALLDLGIGVPAIVATCVGVRRGAAWARRALYAVVGSLALIGVAVAGMAVSMFIRDDPAMSAAGMSVMVALGAALAAMAVALYAPLLSAAGPRSR